VNPNVNFLGRIHNVLIFHHVIMLVSVTSNKKGKGKDNTRTKKSSNCPYPTEKELPFLAGISVSIESANECGVAPGICGNAFEAANNCDLTISNDDNCFCQFVASNKFSDLNEEDCTDVLEALPELFQNFDRRELGSVSSFLKTCIDCQYFGVNWCGVWLPNKDPEVIKLCNVIWFISMPKKK